MSATRLAERRGPNGLPVMEYSVTWWNNVKTETLPMLPQLVIDPYSRPANMEDLHLWPFAFMYLEYDHNGRHLQREAVNCIMGMVFHGEGYEARSNTYAKLDNVKDTVVIAVRRLADLFREAWKPCIDDWYQEAYNRYPSFKARHDYLPGLLGRLPKMTLDKPCHVGRTREIWEICIVYVVVNSSRTRQDEVFSKNEHKEIIGHWWKSGPERTASIVTRLANPADKDTKNIKSVVFNFAAVLMAGAGMVVNEYEEEKLEMSPREGAALLATTASLEGMSLEATASGPSRSVASGPSRSIAPVPSPAAAPTSSQPTGPGAGQLNAPATRTPDPFEQFTHQSTYSQSPAPRTPAGGGGTDPHDKGKGRARESTSSSSGGDKSGTGKGKKPRREK